MYDPVSAIVGGAAMVGSAIVSSKSAKKASKAQAAAAAAAQDTQWAMYQQSRIDQMPWWGHGKRNLYRLDREIQKGPPKWHKSAYFRQGLREEERAIDRYNSSRGLYASGKAAKDLQANALNNMNRNRGNWINEWMTTRVNPMQSLANVGQTAASNIGRQGINTGNVMAQSQMAAGNARASGYINQANAVSGGLNDAATMFGDAYERRRNQPVAPPVAPPATNFTPTATSWGRYAPLPTDYNSLWNKSPSTNYNALWNG